MEDGMVGVLNRVLDWAITGDNAFSNGDALAVIQIVILLYAFRDRFFTGFSLQRLTKDVERIEKHLNGVYGDIQYVRGAIQSAIVRARPDSTDA